MKFLFNIVFYPIVAIILFVFLFYYTLETAIFIGLFGLVCAAIAVMIVARKNKKQ